jgi:hypothetical protein
LGPSQTLLRVVAGGEKRAAQRFNEKMHRRSNIVHRNGDVIDKSFDHLKNVLRVRCEGYVDAATHRNDTDRCARKKSFAIDQISSPYCARTHVSHLQHRIVTWRFADVDVTNVHAYLSPRGTPRMTE